MDMPEFLQAIVLLAAGSLLTLLSSVVTERRSDRRLDEERKDRSIEVRRLDGVRHVEAAMKMLDQLEGHMEAQILGRKNITGFELDSGLLRQFENEISLVPDKAFRDGVGDGIGLLIALQDLAQRNMEPSGARTFTLSATVHNVRELGAAYLRGESSPQETLDWLSREADEAEAEFQRPVPPTM